MAFLNINDYSVQIRSWVTNIITDENEDIRIKSELMAQGEMESYLRTRYDTTLIFDPALYDEDQTLDERNQTIVMYLIDMAVYHLHANISPESVPDIRETRYKAAINWLKDVSKGNINPNLPEKTSEDGEAELNSLFNGGSNDPVTDRY
jgi:phage gp36-like protein